MVTNNGKTKLKFNKSIISTSDNIIPTQELLNHLSDLHEELSTLSQEGTDLSSLDSYSKDLINKKLLKHKDFGVRAFTSCCLSDILRIYAPNAPYTDIQLTDIFKLVLSQFEMLGEPDNAHIIQQTYLITKMLEYRSIVLLTDLPTSNKLLEELFEIFYDDRKCFPSKLYKVIAGILGEVISEFDSVPLNVLKLIFNKFLTYNPNDIPKGLGVISNTGYELSLILCDEYSNRISRQLTRYYSEILYQVNKDNDVDGISSTYEMNPNVIKTITKLHKLVLRLWETCPDLISAVIGYIQHELSSPHDEIRKSATKLVGNFLTLETSENFLPKYQEVFDAWVLKITDVDPEVRMQWVDTIPKILSSRNDISEEISKGLNKTLIDSEVQVRRLSVQVFTKVPVKAIWKNIHELSVYSSLLYLTREKNKEIRDLSILAAGQLYSESLDNIPKTSENSEIWAIVDTIPATLLNLYYINNKFINEEVDKIIFEYILPLESDDNKRAKRLFTVLSHCDDKAFAAFFAFNKRQLQMSLAVSKYIEFCEILNRKDKENSNDIDNNSDLELRIKFNKTLEWLSSSLSDKIKALESLKLIKEINDSRVFFLIKSCINNDASIVTIKNSMKELLTKLRDPGLFRKYDIPSVSTVLPKDLASQIETLLLRSSPLIYNVSNINLFLNSSEFSDDKEKDLTRKLLDDITNINPTAFKDQVTKLKDIVSRYDVDKNDTDKDTPVLNETLKTLYKIIKVLKDDVAFDDSFFMSRLKEFAIDGSTLTAKYSTKILSMSKDHEELLSNVKNSILPLNIEDGDNFVSHILVLMEILRFHPEILDDNLTDIVGYLIKDVLLSNQVTGDIEGYSTEWIENDELLTTENEKFASLNSKIYTLKLLTNKLRSISPDVGTEDSSSSFAQKTMKLFFYLIASGGELVSENNKENYPTPNVFQTKLRCYAGLQVLKLARVANMNDFIVASDIIKLVNLVEDECLPVRRLFLDTLKTSISNELISIKFLPLIFFTAYEPDETLKKTTKTWINYTVGKPSFKKGTFFERALPRLIHAISHHPDIIDGINGNDTEQLTALKTSIDYLIFYFDSIASQENFSLLYYLSERIKNYQDDIEDEEDEEDEEEEEQGPNNQVKKTNNERMYIIGELAQIILLQLKNKRGWQHTAYPGKLNLPNDLFRPFNSVEDAQASFKTYISDKYLATVKSTIKLKVGKIVHTSQTQRQRAQKRMLANEYQSNKTPEDHVTKKRKRNQSAQDIDDENDEPEKAYVPTGGKVVYNNLRKKNLRERKTVNYNEDDD